MAGEQFSRYVEGNPHISGPQNKSILETIYEIDSSNEQGSDYDADEEDNSNSKLGDLSEIFEINESGKLVLSRIANDPSLTNSTSDYSIPKDINKLFQDSLADHSSDEIDRMLDQELANYSDSGQEDLESLEKDSAFFNEKSINVSIKEPESNRLTLKTLAHQNKCSNQIDLDSCVTEDYFCVSNPDESSDSEYEIIGEESLLS